MHALAKKKCKSENVTIKITVRRAAFVKRLVTKGSLDYQVFIRCNINKACDPTLVS